MNRAANWVVLLSAALVVVRSQPARGQLGVTISGTAVQPRSTLVLGGIREAVTGVWAGAEIELKLGPATVTGVGLRGNLSQTENTFALKRDAGELRGRLTVSPVRWLGLEAGYGVRAFSSAAGYQRWNVPSAGVRFSSQLGHPALQAYARGAYLPAVKVSGQPTPDLGLAAEVGVAASPPRTPLRIAVDYRLERYDFPGSTRIEQFDAVTVQIGFRVGGTRR